MSKIPLITVALLALSQTAFAQIVDRPSAGGQILQVPPAPARQRLVPEIRIEQGGMPATQDADAAKITVNSLHVTGEALYSEAHLVAITGFSPGAELTLSELRGMAAKIADYYHRNGYFVAQAYLPAQDVKDGTVEIAVIEGRYGSVTLRNTSNLSDAQANRLLEGLNSGDTVAIAPLESRLLLLSDTPGVIVKSTLAPGAEVGTSDLIVDVTPGQRVSGYVEADNAGNRYTGEYRLGATVNINNPTGHGDVASLRVLTSGSGMTYGRASYQTQFGKATVGAAYAAMHYQLSKEYESLHAHGTAEIASIYASYPLIRSRNTNLYALVDFDARTFQDRTDTPFSVTDKRAKVLMASLYGNHRDGFGGGGMNSYSLTATAGDLDIRTPAALDADQGVLNFGQGPHTNGHYGKLGFYAARLQSVTDRFSLYGAINGQTASKNLDISEKLGLGGMYAVRAYPAGEGYVDQGYVVNLEARLALPKFSPNMPGQMQLIGFVDTGSGTIYRNPWMTGDNRSTVSGAGVGLSWSDYNNFAVNMYWAHKLGSAVLNPVTDASSRFWIQLIKYF